MKKRYTLLACFVIFSILGYSQSITPMVVGSTGGHFTSSEAQLSWTVGEPITETVTNDFIITQGFHQPFNRHHSGIMVVENEANMHAYPNPTSGNLIVSFDQNHEGFLLQWYDATGRLVMETAVEENEKEVLIDLSFLASGQYTFRANNLSTGSVTTYRIQKVL